MNVGKKQPGSSRQSQGWKERTRSPENSLPSRELGNGQNLLEEVPVSKPGRLANQNPQVHGYKSIITTHPLPER